MSDKATKWITGVSYALLLAAATFFFHSILDDFIQSTWLTWLIPVLAALGAFGILVKSIVGPSTSPPALPPGLTQEVFNFYADAFLKQFVSRWKIIAWILGVFAAFGLAFYGIDAHQLRKQLRDGEVETLRKKVQHVVQQTSKLPEILGQLSAATAAYDLAKNSSELQQYFGLGQLEIAEKQQEAYLIQKSLIYRATQLASLNLEGKKPPETIADHYERIATYVSELTLTRDSQLKFEGFHNRMHDAVGHNHDFAEPLLAIVERLRIDKEIKHSEPKHLKHIGHHLKLAEAALQKEFYQEHSEYKRFLLGKLHLEFARYFTLAILECSDKPSALTLCAQLADIVGLKLADFMDPERQDRSIDEVTQAAYDALDKAEDHFSALQTKGAKAILTPRLYHLRLAIAYLVEGTEESIKKARRYAIKAISGGRRIGVPMVGSLNALALIYATEEKMRKHVGFKDKQFQAVKYAHEALQGRLPDTIQWMDTLDTYAVALSNLGFHYYAVLKGYELLIASRDNKKDIEEKTNDRTKKLACGLLLGKDGWGSDGFLAKAISHYQTKISSPLESNIAFKTGRLYHIAAIVSLLCHSIVETGSQSEKDEQETKKQLGERERNKQISRFLCNGLIALQPILNVPQEGFLAAIVYDSIQVLLNDKELKFDRCDVKSSCQQSKTSDKSAKCYQPDVTAINTTSDTSKTKAHPRRLEVNIDILNQHLVSDNVYAYVLNNFAWQLTPEINDKGQCPPQKTLLAPLDYAMDAVVVNKWERPAILHTLASIAYCMGKPYSEMGWSILVSILCDHQTSKPKSEPHHFITTLVGHFKSRYKKTFMPKQCDQINSAF